MLIAITVLFALYETKTPKENPIKKHTLKKPQTTKQTTTHKNTTYENPNQQNTNTKTNCPHHLGYLKTTKQKGIPQECTECPELAECLTTKK